MSDPVFFVLVFVAFAAEFGLGYWRGTVVERRQRVVRRPPYKLLHPYLP